MTLTRNQRLDRLNVSPKHRKLLLGAGIGWALDAMDVGMISFIMAALVVHWGITPSQSSWLASAGFIGMAIGATMGGLLADKLGRRNIFALTLLVYGLATGASALATGLGTLIVLRFIVGLGLGGELPVASTLVTEFAPLKVRGRMVVILESFWAVGWILAAVIGTVVIGASESGWRWALAIGLVPALYAMYVRSQLPESVRYLDSRGRHEEAEAVVASFEAQATVSTDYTPAEPEEDNSTSIWSPNLRRKTAALWVIWACINLSYYGAFIWIPSLLVADGFSLVRSFSFTLIITVAQLPGYAVAAWLIEVWGRRITLITFLLGSAISAGLFGLSHSVAMILIAGIMLSFFNLGAWGALYAISPELYPTTLRGRGTGAAAGFGRLASISATPLVPLVVAAVGTGWLFAIFALCFGLAALATSVLPERRGKVLS